MLFFSICFSLVLNYSNAKKVILSSVLVGIFFGFIRSYLNSSDMDERKKLRKVKNFLRKKGRDLLLDKRIAGIVSVIFIIASPFWISHQSQNPTFFGMYSSTFMFL